MEIAGLRNSWRLDVEGLIRDCVSGETTMSQAARKYGCSVPTIWGHLARRGLQPARKGSPVHVTPDVLRAHLLAGAGGLSRSQILKLIAELKELAE